MRGLPSSARSSRALPDAAIACLSVEFGGVDRDGERADLDGPRSHLDLAEPRPDPDRPAGGVGADEAPREVEEVLRATGKVEADQVGPEQSLDDLGPPRHLHEQLDGRKRDVQEEADRQVGAQLAQHLRYEL